MDHYFKSIISGEANGILPALLRGTLAVLSLIYNAIIYLRNLAYDKQIFKTTKLPIPVISVGNITVGGTGKTPTVIMIAHQLQALGKRPAVLTRGYGGTREKPADEVLVLQQELPNVPIIVNPDRVAGGREAIAQHNADILILDDGFQHRRLHRDLNIVLLDATAPMGIPGVLPRGTWREPPCSLSRADILMLTRTEQVTQELADLAAGLLTQWAIPHKIFQQTTQVTGLFDSRNQPVPHPVLGQRVLAFAGIGNPANFLTTVRSLGLTVTAACWFDDHHHYQLPQDFAQLEKITKEKADLGLPIQAWVTTLKDQVKLQYAQTPVPLYHVRIAATITGFPAALFTETLAQLANVPLPTPEESPVAS